MSGFLTGLFITCGPQIASDDVLKDIAGLTNLENLELEGIVLTDAGMEQLKEMENLGWLYVPRRARLTERGFKTLASLPHSLGYCVLPRLTAEGVPFLLERETISDEAFVTIAVHGYASANAQRWLQPVRGTTHRRSQC